MVLLEKRVPAVDAVPDGLEVAAAAVFSRDVDAQPEGGFGVRIPEEGGRRGDLPDSRQICEAVVVDVIGILAAGGEQDGKACLLITPAAKGAEVGAFFIG